ncbi:MAG: NAD-dependent epimerase/dehydratase family protein [Bdellovibrionota bacterium]|nr:NAD-dependent epimerase/dehydratase family protein [Bdellovibrionota bacterium]
MKPYTTPKKILITGATGSLGMRLTEVLSQENIIIIATGRNPTKKTFFEKLNIEYLIGDLSDRNFVNEITKDVEVVIHCAAFTSPFAEWELFEKSNIVSTQNIVNSCQLNRVRRLIHISTPSIYFDGKAKINIKEGDSIPEARSFYAKSKWEAEKIVQNLKSSAVEFIILRPRAIFGRYDSVLLPRMLKIMEKGFFPLFNNGEALMDLTYVDNVVHAIKLSINARGTSLGLAFNITNGEPKKLKEITDMIIKIRKIEVVYRKLPFALMYAIAAMIEVTYKMLNIKREPPLSRYGVGVMAIDQTLNIERAKSLLGYEPVVSLEDGLRYTLNNWGKDD